MIEENKNKKHILVTGGAGFIGTNLIKKLLKKNYKVTSIDNYSTGLKSNHQKECEYLTYDIRNPFNYPPLFTDKKYDVIFHLGAVSRIQPSFENPNIYVNTNIVGTHNVIKYCVDNKIPLIYAGSSSHHSGKFKNPYTFSKSTGEEIVELYKQHFKLRASIARFYNVYGPHQLTEGGYTTLIGRWLNNIEKKKDCEIYGDGEQRRDFTHVSDIVDGLITIMETRTYKYTFEFGRGKNYSVNEVAEMFGINPIYKKAKPGEAKETLCDISLAKNILNWEPRVNLEDYINKQL